MCRWLDVKDNNKIEGRLLDGGYLIKWKKLARPSGFQPTGSIKSQLFQLEE